MTFGHILIIGIFIFLGGMGMSAIQSSVAVIMPRLAAIVGFTGTASKPKAQTRWRRQLHTRTVPVKLAWK